MQIMRREGIALTKGFLKNVIATCFQTALIEGVSQHHAFEVVGELRDAMTDELAMHLVEKDPKHEHAQLACGAYSVESFSCFAGCRLARHDLMDICS